MLGRVTVEHRGIHLFHNFAAGMQFAKATVEDETTVGSKEFTSF